MKIIAAPGRQIRTWSMILTGFLTGSGAFIALIQTFKDLDLISSTFAAAFVAVIGTMIIISRFILQNIPMTTKQKHAVVSAAAAQPMKPGSANIQVKIDKLVAPSTPKGAENAKP